MRNSVDNESADKKQGVKGTEVFVGGLAPSVTETKLREIFSACGEIVEVRMIKDHKGNSMGYCFLRFSTREAALKAVKDTDAIMLEGRKIGVHLSIEQNSLFVGNLPKEWSPAEFDRLVRQVFEEVVSVNLVMHDGIHSNQKQQNRGFGFVQFASHAAAARAYRVGSRTDFVLGGRCHPTVQWAEEQPEIDPKELAKVKVAFIRNLPQDVNEDYLKKLFGAYGKIEKVVLSRKGPSQAGFVHFAERPDLEAAVKEMNDITVNGPSSGSFKLQVEVARPFEKSKKRAREISSKTVSQSKSLKAEPGVHSSGDLVLKVLKDPVVVDPYEAAVVSLPVAVQDRLLRILRLGIATRYDIDIQCLRSLKELPESVAISILDQFLLSGADEIDKGAFLAGLIQKYLVRNLGASRMLDYTARASNVVRVRTDLSRLSDRSLMPAVDSMSSHIASTVPRYDPYSPCFSSLDYSLSSRAAIRRIAGDGNPSPLQFCSSSPNYGSRGVASPLTVGASPMAFSSSPTCGRRVFDPPSALGSSLQSASSQVRFDPFTGEPYKFDPFTGEPIRTESPPRSGGSLYRKRQQPWKSKFWLLSPYKPSN